MVLWPWPSLHCNRCGLWYRRLGPPFTATGVVCGLVALALPSLQQVWSVVLSLCPSPHRNRCGLVALALPSLQQVWSVVLSPWPSLHCNRCGLWSCRFVPPFTATGVVCGLVALALPSLQQVWSVVLSLCPSLNETLQRLSSLASLKQNQSGGDRIAGVGYAPPPPTPPWWPSVIWVPSPPPPPPAPLRRKRR